MTLIKKILRKTGLGKIIIRLLALFFNKPDALPDLNDARRTLEEFSPDKGSSAIRGITENTAATHELDVIVPVYNAEKYLERCISSVLSQKTKYRVRLILVNDGSADASGEIMRRYEGDGRFLLLHRENGGAACARNTGLEHSSAGYVMFLDADDILGDGCVEALLSLAYENSAAIVEGAYSIVRPDGGLMRFVGHKTGVLSLPTDCTGFPCGSVIRREYFDALCFPEGYWYEDSLMYQLLLPYISASGASAIGSDINTFNYTVNPHGMTGTGQSRPKSLDSLYVTLSLARDRAALGMENNRQYYEYILNMLVQTYRRTQELPDEIKRSIFVVWRDFVTRQFPDFRTERKPYSVLEKAVYQGNYRLYRIFCSLIKD